MALDSLIHCLLVETRFNSFLVRSEYKNGCKEYIFHAVDITPPAGFTKYAREYFAARGIKANCKVRLHNSDSLVRLNSLEAISKAFGSGELVYDPTHLAERMSALVQLARSLRIAIPSVITRIGFESRRRTVYILLDENRHARTPVAVRETMQKAALVVNEWHLATRLDIDLSVRVGFDAPLAATLVPVDAASAQQKVRYLLSRFSSRLGRNLGLSALLGLSAAPAAVSAEPAVSQTNATVITKGGVVDDDEFFGVGGKAAFPLGESLGAQIDAAGGTDEYYGIGGHLFWRDPSAGMLGILGTVESWDSVDMQRVGAEGEVYFDSITLGGIAGYQTGDVDEGGYGRIDLKFYATPDFLLKAGGEFTPEMNLGRVGVEWRPGFNALPGLSIFADGELGEDDSDSIMLGITYHFGKKGSSLMHRDRREDPSFALFNLGQLHHARQTNNGQGYPPIIN